MRHKALKPISSLKHVGPDGAGRGWHRLALADQFAIRPLVILGRGLGGEGVHRWTSRSLSDPRGLFVPMHLQPKMHPHEWESPCNQGSMANKGFWKPFPNHVLLYTTGVLKTSFCSSVCQNELLTQTMKWANTTPMQKPTSPKRTATLRVSLWHSSGCCNIFTASSIVIFPAE